MREEFAEHEGVVGLGVVFREPDVLVHVECDDILETTRLNRQNRSPCMDGCGGKHVRKLASLDEADEVLICGDGGRARWETEHERLLWRGVEVVYPAGVRRSISFACLPAGFHGSHRRTYEHIPLGDVVSDVLSDSLRIVTDDETWKRVNTGV